MSKASGRETAVFPERIYWLMQSIPYLEGKDPCLQN